MNYPEKHCRYVSTKEHSFKERILYIKSFNINNFSDSLLFLLCALLIVIANRSNFCQFLHIRDRNNESMNNNNETKIVVSTGYEWISWECNQKITDVIRLYRIQSLLTRSKLPSVKTNWISTLVCDKNTTRVSNCAKLGVYELYMLKTVPIFCDLTLYFFFTGGRHDDKHSNSHWQT